MTAMQETIKEVLRGRYQRDTLLKYEVVLIINPDYSMPQVLEVFQKLESQVQGYQGMLSPAEYWGFRTLAYPIHKRNKAHYVYCTAQLDPSCVKELERFLSVELHGGIFRHLVLKVKDESLLVEPTMLRQSSLVDAVNGASKPSSSVS
ncbi:MULTISPECIES: 30S ribosomal protein S6 [Holospora]|uniref:Small ribosomal subunit protein bS6 n=2 Tax=Holospora TaxID=44747 RepID=A0A061JI47_9PROT|nr:MULTISPECIES: 30S ribosomal protein S6 [Holospora]ETZ04669.1 30S ribosomal protein S6 [Holospora undulata HU1]GAJ45856.1 30S ribosomal protein S6 [Holospora elegans E1]